jgi:hypothetical protein
LEISELKSTVKTLSARVTAMDARHTQIDARHTQQNDHIIRLLQRQGGVSIDSDGDEVGGEDDPVNDATATAPATGQFPLKLQYLTVKTLFKNWYIQGYYKNIGHKSNDSHIRSTVKFTIEYVTMFLETHIPPIPEGVTDTMTPAAMSWRADLTRLVDGAWTAIEAFHVLHNQRISEKVHVFKKFMTERDSADWPPGPAGEANIRFQPPEFKYSMRTYQQMCNHQSGQRAKSEEQKAKKARLSNDAIIEAQAPAPGPVGARPTFGEASPGPVGARPTFSDAFASI